MNLKSYRDQISAPFDEPVDARRNEFHVNWIHPKLLTARLNSQAYRPEIVSAREDLRSRHDCVPLSSACKGQVRQGKTPSYGVGGPPCLRLKDVRHIIVTVDETSTVSDEFAAENIPISSDAILINRSGAFCVGRTGAYLRRSPVFVSDDVFLGIPNKLFDAAFIACFLNSWWGKRSLEFGINGSTGQLKLSQAHVRDIPIPVFPLAIQTAIGNRVRKAERLRELAASSRVKGEQWLLDFIHFHPPLDSNRPTWSDRDTTGTHRFDAEYYGPTYLALDHFLVDWQKSGKKVDRLEDLIKEGGYGVLPSSDHYGQGALKFLRAQDVGSLLINQSVDLVVPGYYANKKAISKANDVLLEVKGEIAGCAVCPGEMAGCLLNGSIYRMAVSDSINPYYLAAFLISPTGRLQKKRAAANSVISYLSVDFLNNLRIPRLGDEKEEEIGSAIRMFVDFTVQSKRLVEEAKSDVDALIEGTLDEAVLLNESATIEKWFTDNPSPNLSI